MKIKNIFSVIGLGLFAAVSVGAGVALAKSAKAEPVNADANTWMVRFQLDLGSCSPSSPSSVFPAENQVDGVRFHYWGDGGVDETVRASKMFARFEHDYYAINVSLADSQTINGAQWILEQRGIGDKYSIDITQFGDSLVTSLNKDTTVAGLQYQFDNVWTEVNPGDWHWALLKDEGDFTTYYKADIGVDEHTYPVLQKEPANNVFAIRNLTLSATDGVSFETENGVMFSSNCRGLLDAASLEFVGGDQPNWFWLYGGTYDIILASDCMKIRKHVDDYYAVYLIGVEDDVWVYTFGENGYEQFGEFPGTQLSAIAGKSDVKGDLHFQGSDFGLWTLDVYIGYPKADHMILSYKNEYGIVANQSADMLLVPESAYYFSDVEDYYNDDASAALNFLSYAEEYRLGATNESICNISESNAKLIVNKYNLLSDDQREIYVDSTTVNTHKRDGSEGKEYVSYRLVMEQISAIAGIDLEGGSGRNISSPIANATSVDSTTLIAVVSIVAFISLSSIGVMLVIKKRKHQ